jgi:hypothetical protein
MPAVRGEKATGCPMLLKQSFGLLGRLITTIQCSCDRCAVLTAESQSPSRSTDRANAATLHDSGGDDFVRVIMNESPSVNNSLRRILARY